MHLFYTPELSAEMPDFILNEEESKHCIKVLRLSAADKIVLVDGRGNWCEAQIIDPHPKRCVVHINKRLVDYGKKNFHLHMAISPTKNIDRFEWFLEKSTEIGIDEITPIICQQSERKIIKHDRSERVIIAAMKQSLKAFLPQLNPLITFKDFIAKHKNFVGEKYLAHCHDKAINALKDTYTREKDVLILIGPEGDFSLEEIQLAQKEAYQEISLGDSRLRTETAGIVACHTIGLLNESRT